MKKENSRLLSLNNVGLYYTRRNGLFQRKKHWALRDVSFELHNGETLGVIGRNGVGKSTLLRVLAGIMAPDRGKIITYQKQIRISLISLQAGFVLSLSGRQNIILSGMLLGNSKREMEFYMNDIIKFSELEDFIDQPVNTYSTGMRARLGFSIAFYADPDVILLDEVLGVGDEEFRKKSTNAMKTKIKSDKTVVIVSHNQYLLKNVCDKIVWIENGTTRAQGDVNDVIQEYISATK